MSARRTSPSLLRRALGAIGAGALTGALALLAFAVFSPDEPTVAVDVEPAIAESPPPTVVPSGETAPTTTVTIPARPPDAAVPELPSPTVTIPARPPDVAVPELPSTPVEPSRSRRDRPEGATDEKPEPAATSPLAELLDEPFSAVPEPVAARPRPTGIQIGSIDVSRFPVRPIGLEADGQLEVPDETEIGWYRYGSTPGRRGATVLAAHVSWNSTSGPFAQLGTVDPGDSVEVRLDDGAFRRYEVVERAIYGKLELPTDRIWRTTGREELVLITCGGDFNPDIRRYRDNIVVYAVPVG